MTDRIVGFTVVLQKSMRDDDVEEIKNAVSMIKGVEKIESVVQSSDAFIAESRTKYDIQNKLLEFIKSL